MAKMDVSKIDGYADMSPEEKLAALEGYEWDEPDYSGYIKKEVFDKTASELASAKKQLKEHMSAEEVQRQQEAEERVALQQKYDALLRQNLIAGHKASLMDLGYDAKLADETAVAMVDGNTDAVFANQKKAFAALEKRIRAEVLKDTPRPVPDGESQGMTLEKLRQLSPADRLTWAENNPESYKELYTGGLSNGE